MPLSPGTTLGPYQIDAPLGAGGMGEVYKATDTRLDRTVAIKVLPEHVADDPDLRQRFEREAKTISSLNHPHICTLYDVGQEDGIDFLVMEYLDGETLAQRLEKGAVPLDQALTIAIEIADALDKAHRQGILHRDLKPGNIMLTKSGAKLLDFGLAKLKPAEQTGGLSALPTQPANLTQQGAILGTFQYMAPESLEGQEADARTDIFALGAVIYEIVSGRKAFEGKSQASLISAIMKDAPQPMAEVNELTPTALDHIVTRCLAKDPDERWQAASDVALELRWIAEGSQEAPRDSVVPPRVVVPWHVALLAAVALALLSGAMAWNLRPGNQEVATQVTRLAVSLLSPGVQFSQGISSGGTVALSADGTHLAFATSGQLYLRPMDTLEATPIPETDGAASPFFSPDGQWIGFFQQGKLKRVSILGGVAEDLADAGQIRVGGSWASDDWVYFSPTNVSGLWRVPAFGGVEEQVTALDPDTGEVSHRGPQALPGGEAVLFTAWHGPGWDERQVELHILETEERRLLVPGGESGRYVSTGHIVYRRGDQLMAVPFDETRLEVTGTAVPLGVDDVSGIEGADFAVSETGTLAYVSAGTGLEGRLAWRDRQGRTELVPGVARAYQSVAISPDGRKAAVTIAGPVYSVWIHDFERGTQIPLVSDGSSQYPVWSPDGQQVVYRGTRAGRRNLYMRAADSRGAEEPLTTGGRIHTPGSFSPNGEWLAFYEVDPDTGANLWVLPLAASGSPEVLVRTQFAEVQPVFSPNGRWVAFTSDQSGRLEIWVSPFPTSGRGVQLSTDGGTGPVRWSRDGTELFYRSGDSLMALPFSTEDGFGTGIPEELFGGLPLNGWFDVAPDGQRFLTIQPAEADVADPQLNVVLHWFEELKARVPVD